MSKPNMTLEQLEKLLENPNYTLSEEQLKLLYELRSEDYKPFVKETGTVNKVTGKNYKTTN